LTNFKYGWYSQFVALGLKKDYSGRNREYYVRVQGPNNASPGES